VQGGDRDPKTVRNRRHPPGRQQRKTDDVTGPNASRR
jgi:hypothetical protein